MGKFKEETIRNVIDQLNDSYFVPDIQRSYVWLQNPKEKKIEQLFDSLMRGYPIGSFLFWHLKTDDIETDNSDKETSDGKLNFQLYKFIENYDVRKSHNEKINITQVKSSDLHIVLDGQQRLTSLYIGLRGSRCLRRPYARKDNPNPYDVKYLFLNLKHQPSEDNPEDGYQFEFKTLDEVRRSEPEKYMWFRVSEILKFSNNKESIRSYCSDKGYDRNTEDMITDLYNVISTEQNISYFEETEKSLDKVLKIFIRVNSGGMQLSYSDLLMSLLTATFQSEIRDNMERFVDVLRDKGFSCVGRDQVLKTCLMLSGCNHIFKLSNFSKSNIRKIESNWTRITECITNAIGILSNLGYKNQLSSGYIASVIAYYLFKNPSNKLSHQDKDSIGMFVRIAQIRSFFSAGLDGKLSKCKEYLDVTNNFTEFLEKAKNSFDGFKIQSGDIDWYIENIKYGSNALLPLLQLLYPNFNYGTTVFHIDHIYPKSKFVKTTSGLPSNYIGRENDLFNLQLLEGIVNEEKKAKDPETWLEKEYPDVSKREKYLADNYIPQDFVLDWDKLPNFEEKRKPLLVKALYKAFGIRVKEEGMNENGKDDELDFDDNSGMDVPPVSL